jgi:hypothetical protein
MTRTEIQQLFVSKFHQGNTLLPASAAGVQLAEQEFATVLPQSYVTFLQTYGPVVTPTLLSIIVEGGHNLWDVMSFFSIEEVVEDTKNYWKAGMPNVLIGFASDSMGNLFCFRRLTPDSNRIDDAEIWFFDHEFCSNKKIADGFDAWLLSYTQLVK